MPSRRKNRRQAHRTTPPRHVPTAGWSSRPMTRSVAHAANPLPSRPAQSPTREPTCRSAQNAGWKASPDRKSVPLAEQYFRVKARWMQGRPFSPHLKNRPNRPPSHLSRNRLSRNRCLPLRRLRPRRRRLRPKPIKSAPAVETIVLRKRSSAPTAASISNDTGKL